MASNSKKLKRKRSMKKRKMGKSRKRETRIHGTTPSFPVHKEKPPSKTEQQG